MKNARIIGVMSGTSLDGLDLVAVDFAHDKSIQWEIIACSCINYSKEWKDKLLYAHELNSMELLELDVAYGRYIGDKINDFIATHKLNNIDYIASHGHTIFHQPKNGYTLQIGHGAHIQSCTDIPVICDFRSHDVALGGQGAPLVPIGDKLLFSDYDACVNLGGFANISFEQNQERIAFDICAVNFVLNHYTECIGLPFDDKGAIAKEHPVDSDLLGRLNQVTFYQQKPPKSLGREWVEKEIFPLFQSHEIPQEIISTYTHHAAAQIAKVLNEYKLRYVLFTGGGTRNDELMRIIQSKTNSRIVIGEEHLIDYKEALIFALLGWLRVNNKTNVLASVTGAKRNSCSGVLYN